jgi:hypothetical protein
MMKDFRTFDVAKREPAVAMKPVIDPAGWEANSLGPVEDWSCHLTSADQDELVAGVSAFRKTGRSIVDVNRDNFPLSALATTLSDIRRELNDGRGLVMIRNFPIDRLDRESVAIAYMGFGSYLGEKMVQNKHGHVLGHVKDLGEDYDTSGRAYNTNAELRFHSDACDYVGLLCLHPAKSGGESRVASSVTVYNKILERRPDLAKVLSEDFYRSYGGEMNPGEQPFYKQPIFTFADGYFSAVGAGVAIDKATKLPGVPPLSTVQAEAIQLYRDIVADLAVDIPFKPGDIQLLSNYVTLHSRRGFQDWPERNRRRHLLRLWIKDVNGRPVPKQIREGRRGQGIRIDGLKMTAPLEAEAAVA